MASPCSSNPAISITRTSRTVLTCHRSAAPPVLALLRYFLRPSSRQRSLRRPRRRILPGNARCLTPLEPGQNLAPVLAGRVLAVRCSPPDIWVEEVSDCVQVRCVQSALDPLRDGVHGLVRLGQAITSDSEATLTESTSVEYLSIRVGSPCQVVREGAVRVFLLDIQSRSDAWTTRRYEPARHNLYRHPTYVLAGMVK